MTYETLWTWPGKGLLISMLKKLILFNFTSLITLVLLLMWKCMVLLLKKNHLLRCWNCLSLLNWLVTLALSLLQKVLPSKMGHLSVKRSLLILKLLFISENLTYSLAWNFDVLPGLVLQATTWICWINYTNEYVNLWLFVEM